MRQSPSTSTTMTASDVIDLLGVVSDNIRNAAQAMFHRPEDAEHNPHMATIDAAYRGLTRYMGGNKAFSREPIGRALMVEVPNTLLDAICTLPGELRAIGAEEIGKTILGHIEEPEDRLRTYMVREIFNPGRFVRAQQRREEGQVDSHSWQERIDRIITNARKRPEPIKQLEGLADLACEIIDAASCMHDRGREPKDKFVSRAHAIKQAIFNECRRAPYLATPKFMATCTTQIEALEALAHEAMEAEKAAPFYREGEGDIIPRLQVGLERCSQFQDALQSIKLRRGGREGL